MLTAGTLYFAYGANVNIEDMSYRCPGARPLGAFELRDWQLEFYTHATIEERAGSRVHGVLWNLTEDCERSLDMFEGFPHYYTKRTWSQDGHWFFFYEMTSPKKGTPGVGYIQGIAEGYHRWQLPPKLLQEAIDRSYTTHSYNLQY